MFLYQKHVFIASVKNVTKGTSIKYLSLEIRNRFSVFEWRKNTSNLLFTQNELHEQRKNFKRNAKMPASITTGYPTRISSFLVSQHVFLTQRLQNLFSQLLLLLFFFKVCFRIFLSWNEATSGKPLKCKKRHKKRIERTVKHLIAFQ